MMLRSRSRPSCPLLLACFAMACAAGDDDRWNPDIPPGTPVVNVRIGSRSTARELDLSQHPGLGATVTELQEATGAIAAIDLDTDGVAIALGDRLITIAPNGELLGVLGRAGQGPNEFGNLHVACGTRGDTIVAEDYNNRRLQIIDAQTRTILRTLPGELGRLSPQSCFADGTFVVAEISRNSEAGTRELSYRRFALDGTSRGTLHTVSLSDDRFREVGYPVHAAHGSDWWFADPYFAEVRRFDTTGALQGIVRLELPLQGVSRTEAFRARGIEAAVGSKLARGASERVGRRAFVRDIAVAGDGRLVLTEPPHDADEVPHWIMVEPQTGKAYRLALGTTDYRTGVETVGVSDNGVLFITTSPDGTRSVVRAKM